MDLRRWSRKNDPASVRARQDALREAGVDGEVLWADLSPWQHAQESLTGAAVIPVGTAEIPVELGDYELRDEDGAVVERARAAESVFVPLAHTEGGLTASVQRGGKAAEASGGFRTYVLYDRITRASCFVCADVREATELARWIESQLDDMRAFLASGSMPELSTRAKLREVKTHVVGPMCHVLWAWTTGDAVGPNMMTRNSYALNMGYVRERAPVKPQRAILEANMGGDKKPSYEFFQRGHGKTVIAECTLSDEAVRRVLRTTADDLLELAWAGTHGSAASGMQSVAFTPA